MLVQPSYVNDLEMQSRGTCIAHDNFIRKRGPSHMMVGGVGS